MNSVIVVEGTHDAARIKEVYKDAHIIITNGTSLSDAVLNEIIELSKTNEIILFLDPDYPGNKIRQLISSKIENVKHAHIKREHATNGKKIGVEHARLEDIKQALKVRSVVNKTDIDMPFLLDCGYIGNNDSKIKRLQLLNHFNIGYVNGKGLLKKLSLFGITKKQVIDYESKKTLRTEFLKK
ncbi:MAG: ribonuclease M5 [Acholeplasmataceae bacterium]